MSHSYQSISYSYPNCLSCRSDRKKTSSATTESQQIFKEEYGGGSAFSLYGALKCAPCRSTVSKQCFSRVQQTEDVGSSLDGNGI